MDQEVLVKAAGDQLDALQLIIKTAVGAALLSGWAGLQMAEEISIFNMKLSRKDTCYIVAIVFFY